MWFGPHTRVQQANASSGIILQETIPVRSNFYTRSITFTPLLASHAGNYKCDIPLLNSYYLFEVKVICKLACQCNYSLIILYTCL